MLDGGLGCAGGLSSTQTADEEVKLYSPGFFRVSQSLQKPYTAQQPKKVSHCARLVTRCHEMLELMQTGDFNRWCAHGADCRGHAAARGAGLLGGCAGYARTVLSSDLRIAHGHGLSSVWRKRGP